MRQRIPDKCNIDHIVICFSNGKTCVLPAEDLHRLNCFGNILYPESPVYITVGLTIPAFYLPVLISTEPGGKRKKRKRVEPETNIYSITFIMTDRSEECYRVAAIYKNNYRISQQLILLNPLEILLLCCCKYYISYPSQA